MTRKIESRKVVDLGKASRETKGGNIGLPDVAGYQPTGGLTND